MQPLEEVYRTILESLDAVADEQGYISIRHPDGATDPLMVKGKRMVLPTYDILRNPNWDTTIAFHPLSESATASGESDILKKLQMLIKYRLNSVSVALMESLMRIAVEKDNHSKVSPKQADILATLNNAIKATYDSTLKVLNKVSAKGDHTLVNVYLKRGGKWRGTKYARVAITTFPILKEFENEKSKSIFGVEMAARDKALIKELFDYIFDVIEEPDMYNFGSNDLSAPYFHALMHMYLNVAKRLNKIVRRFKNLLDEPDLLMIDTSWEGVLDELHKYRDKIPPLEGNGGDVQPGNVVESGEARYNPQAMRESLNDDEPYTPVASTQPVRSGYTKEPEPKEEEVVSSPFRQFGGPSRQPSNVQVPQAVNHAPAPQHAPQSYNGHHQQRQQPQESYNEPVVTERGLDWNSVVATNPAVQHAVGMGYQSNPGVAMTFAPSYQQAPVHGFHQPMQNYGRGGYTRHGYPAAPVTRGGFHQQQHYGGGYGQPMHQSRGGYNQPMQHGGFNNFPPRRGGF